MTVCPMIAFLMDSEFEGCKGVEEGGSSVSGSFSMLLCSRRLPSSSDDLPA